MNDTKVKDPKRYAHIHVLFRVLAEVKLNSTLTIEKDPEKRRKIYQLAKDSKAYWKRFFHVESLKDLSNKELKDLERILNQRIGFLSKIKHNN